MHDLRRRRPGAQRRAGRRHAEGVRGGAGGAGPPLLSRAHARAPSAPSRQACAPEAVASGRASGHLTPSRFLRRRLSRTLAPLRARPPPPRLGRARRARSRAPAALHDCWLGRAFDLRGLGYATVIHKSQGMSIGDGKPIERMRLRPWGLQVARGERGPGLL